MSILLLVCLCLLVRSYEAILSVEQGFTINGVSVAFYEAGYSVAGIGDWNGDGLDDMAMTSGNDNGMAIIFGTSSSVTTQYIDWSTADCCVQITSSTASMKEWRIAGVGDVNGDGVDDILIGSPNTDLTGAAYLVYGSSDFTAGMNIDLSTHLAQQTNGATFLGTEYSNAGISVSGAGDVNGDSVSDFVIGADDGGDPADDAYYASVVGPGHAYVVFGLTTGNTFPLQTELSQLNGTDGFMITGNSDGNKCGHAVSAAGDFNGDGFFDVVVGSPASSPGGDTDVGEAYIVYGASSFKSNLQVTNIGDWGVKMKGTATKGKAGQSVSFAVDINLDGYSDILISAPHASTVSGDSQGGGRVYVILGQAQPPSTITLNSAEEAITISGSAEHHYLGYSMTSADLNNDGYSDICLGAPEALPGATASYQGPGKVYCIFGFSSFASGTTVATANDVDGADGFIIKGTHSGSFAGSSVSFAGDVNNDGLDDLFVGGYYANFDKVKHAGQGYVVYGTTGPYPRKIKLNPHKHNENESDGDSGWVIFGYVVAALAACVIIWFAWMRWHKAAKTKSSAALLSHNTNPVHAHSAAIPVAMAMPMPQGQTMGVLVPPNAVPGSVLQVTGPNGLTYQVEVPKDCLPGTQLTVAL